MPSRTLNDQSDIPMFARLLGTMKLPVTVSWIDGRDRSAEQNRLMWLWAQEAADQRAEDPEFQSIYDVSIKPLTYEKKLALMAYMPVTSEFKVRQMVAFLDAVERECSMQGIRLTDPDPDLAKYQARYRQKEAA